MQHCCDYREGGHAKVGKVCTFDKFIGLEQIVKRQVAYPTEFVTCITYHLQHQNGNGDTDAQPQADLVSTAILILPLSAK